MDCVGNEVGWLGTAAMTGVQSDSTRCIDLPCQLRSGWVVEIFQVTHGTILRDDCLELLMGRFYATCATPYSWHTITRTVSV